MIADVSYIELTLTIRKTFHIPPQYRRPAETPHNLAYGHKKGTELESSSVPFTLLYICFIQLSTRFQPNA